MRLSASTVLEGLTSHLPLVAHVDIRADLARVELPSLGVVATGDRLVHPNSHHRLAGVGRGTHSPGPTDDRVWWAEVRVPRLERYDEIRIVNGCRLRATPQVIAVLTPSLECGGHELLD